MRITFGILTKDNLKNVTQIVDSIRKQCIPYYEILIIGNVTHEWPSCPYVRVIHDHAVNDKNHITVKKNTVVREALYDVIVIMKDYIALDDGWYQGLLRYGDDFDILMNRIVDRKHRRYLDWIWENPKVGEGRNVPYDVVGHKGMFSPGAFTMAKKSVFDVCMFNEKLVGLGKPTDVQWSQKAMRTFRYAMNVHACCVLIDRHDRYPKFRRMCICDTCKNIADDKCLS